MKKSIFLTVVLAVFFVSAAIADPGDTLWTRTYGGTGVEYGYFVQQTTDGGYIITGYTDPQQTYRYDVYLVKTNANGDTLWTRIYGGTPSDGAYSVQQTTDGGYIIAGYTASFGAGSWDVWLLKIDAFGDTLWTRTYGGSDTDGGYSVQQTSDGGYIVAGHTQSFGVGGSYDVWLLKTDSSGDTLWTRTYGGTGGDFGKSVQQTPDGGYILVGDTDSFGAGSWDFWLVKTDANGDTLWTRTYGGSEADEVCSAQQTTDGGYIIAGRSQSFGEAGDFYLVKTNPNGDTLWTRTYGGELGDFAYSAQQTSDGGYMIAGHTRSFGAGNYDFWLVKTDPNGDTLWTRTYGGSNVEYGYCAQQTTDGGYIVAGVTKSFGAGGYDVYLVKVAGESSLPDVTIEILPDNPPVIVPQGGSFGFTGSLTNNIEDPQVSDGWTMAVGPQKETYGPFKMRNDVALEPFETRTADFNQHVPNLAPLGFYTYTAYCGEYPSTVMDSSSFQVEVIASPAGGATGWVLTGSFLEGESTELPCEFALSGNYPNPFNAKTVISYELPVSGHVKLEVYNLFGQKVATLVDGEQHSGYRSVVWDASEVSSGLYFYKLTAGDFTEVKRMTLLR